MTEFSFGLGSHGSLQYNQMLVSACWSAVMRALFVLSSILWLSACTGMLMGGGSGSERPSSAPRNTQTAADNAISGSLRRQFSADREISQYGIGIRSQGGRVTLTGTVGGYDLRDRIVELTKNTHGVIAVDSRVVVNTNL